MSRNEVIAAMKQRVFEANLELPHYGLVKLTWGNVSEINRELGIIVIKPSGVKYEKMQADQMVVTDLAGHVLDEENLNPSSDLPTHVVLYQAFEKSMPSFILIQQTRSCGLKLDVICPLMERRTPMLFMVGFPVHVR